MAKEPKVSRRTALKYVGALSAFGVTAAIAQKAVGHTTGKPYCLDSESLVLPHTESTAVDKVAAFSEATFTNDLATIMPTYSHWDTNEVFLLANPDGTLTLKMNTSLAEVEQFLSGHISTTRYPGDERRSSDMAGRWFDLLDSQFSQVDNTTGAVTTSRAAFLFATWPDGVIGHIYWGEPSWAPIFDASMPASLMKTLVAYENAWQSGDVDARLALIEDQATCSVVRIASVNGGPRNRFIAQTKADLRAVWTSPSAGKVIELERIYQVISTFYISAGYRLVLEVAGRRVVRETTVLFPLGPHRKFIGELSYSLES